ncbi:MAG: hypothetical protein ACI9IP_002787 [Arcticibacterium sp.]|jgi:hypothetical protein
MPIIEVEAPIESIQIFKDWIELTKPGKRRKKEHKYHEHIPHRVYHTSVKDIYDGGGFQDAEVVSWRYYHKTPKGKHTLVEVAVGEKDNEHNMLEAHYGPMAAEHKLLHNIIKELEEIKMEYFELTFLRIYALKLNAAWLKTDKYQNDYFVPIQPCYNGFEANRVYTFDRFLGMAKKSTGFFSQMVVSSEENEMMGG